MSRKSVVAENSCTGIAPDSVTVTNSSGVLLAENINRVALFLTNHGNKHVWLAFGTHAAVKDKGIRLEKKGGILVFDGQGFDRGVVNAITEAGTASVAIQEFERINQ